MQLQLIFNRVEETKKKIKDIKLAYKDALALSGDYLEIVERIKTLRGRKKQIEESVRAEFSLEFTKLDDLKIDLASDQELLSDQALNQFVKGESIEIEDQYTNRYDPVFKVSFKKK